MTGKGHVPEGSLPRYRQIRELVHRLESTGSWLSGVGAYDLANAMWAQAAKYRAMANELRADLPDEQEEENTQ